MRRFSLTAAAVLGFVSVPLMVKGQTAPMFSVSFPAAQSAKALDGRLLLLLSNSGRFG
jgi:hypothetical protein